MQPPVINHSLSDSVSIVSSPKAMPMKPVLPRDGRDFHLLRSRIQMHSISPVSVFRQLREDETNSSQNQKDQVDRGSLALENPNQIEELVGQFLEPHYKLCTLPSQSSSQVNRFRHQNIHMKPVPRPVEPIQADKQTSQRKPKGSYYTIYNEQVQDGIRLAPGQNYTIWNTLPEAVIRAYEQTKAKIGQVNFVKGYLKGIDCLYYAVERNLIIISSGEPRLTSYKQSNHLEMPLHNVLINIIETHSDISCLSPHSQNRAATSSTKQLVIMCHPHEIELYCLIPDKKDSANWSSPTSPVYNPMHKLGIRLHLKDYAEPKLLLFYQGTICYVPDSEPYNLCFLNLVNCQTIKIAASSNLNSPLSSKNIYQPVPGSVSSHGNLFVDMIRSGLLNPERGGWLQKLAARHLTNTTVIKMSRCPHWAIVCLMETKIRGKLGRFLTAAKQNDQPNAQEVSQKASRRFVRIFYQQQQKECKNQIGKNEGWQYFDVKHDQQQKGEQILDCFVRSHTTDVKKQKSKQNKKRDDCECGCVVVFNLLMITATIQMRQYCMRKNNKRTTFDPSIMMRIQLTKQQLTKLPVIEWSTQSGINRVCIKVQNRIIQFDAPTRCLHKQAKKQLTLDLNDSLSEVEWREHWPVSDQEYMLANKSSIIMGMVYGHTKSLHLRWADWIYATVRNSISTHTRQGNHKMDVAKIGTSLYCKAREITKNQEIQQQQRQATQFKHMMVTMLEISTNLMLLASGNLPRLYLLQQNQDIISIQAIQGYCYESTYPIYKQLLQWFVNYLEAVLVEQHKKQTAWLCQMIRHSQDAEDSRSEGDKSHWKQLLSWLKGHNKQWDQDLQTYTMTQTKVNANDSSSDGDNVQPMNKQARYFMTDLSHQHAKQIVRILYEFSGLDALTRTISPVYNKPVCSISADEYEHLYRSFDNFNSVFEMLQQMQVYVRPEPSTNGQLINSRGSKQVSPVSTIAHSANKYPQQTAQNCFELRFINKIQQLTSVLHIISNQSCNITFKEACSQPYSFFSASLFNQFAADYDVGQLKQWDTVMPLYTQALCPSLSQQQTAFVEARTLCFWLSICDKISGVVSRHKVIRFIAGHFRNYQIIREDQLGDHCCSRKQNIRQIIFDSDATSVRGVIVIPKFFVEYLRNKKSITFDEIKYFNHEASEQSALFSNKFNISQFQSADSNQIETGYLNSMPNITQFNESNAQHQDGQTSDAKKLQFDAKIDCKISYQQNKCPEQMPTALKRQSKQRFQTSRAVIRENADGIKLSSIFDKVELKQDITK